MTEEPTYGAWLGHTCNPPCVLMRVAKEQESRKKMTKKELIHRLEHADERYLDLLELEEMHQHYEKDLEKHVKEVHNCTCDLTEVSN